MGFRGSQRSLLEVALNFSIWDIKQADSHFLEALMNHMLAESKSVLCGTLNPSVEFPQVVQPVQLQRSARKFRVDEDHFPA